MDSFNSNNSSDWGSTPSDGGAQMNYGSGAPTMRPFGSDLPLDQIQVKRLNPPASLTNNLAQEAWARFKEKPGEFLAAVYGPMLMLMVILTPIALIGSLFLGGISAALGRKAQELVLVFSILFQLFMMFVQILLQVAAQYFTISIGLRAIRGQEVSMATVMPQNKKQFMNVLACMFGTTIVQGLAFFAGILMLVIPGYIVAFGTLFTLMVAVDKNIMFVDALKASWALTDGYKGAMFLFFLVAGFAGILISVLTCGIGYFVVIPLFMVMMLLMYDRLAMPGNAYLQEGEIPGVSSVFE